MIKLEIKHLTERSKNKYATSRVEERLQVVEKLLPTR